jgi:hypothetical protein
VLLVPPYRLYVEDAPVPESLFVRVPVSPVATPVKPTSLNLTVSVSQPVAERHSAETFRSIPLGVLLGAFDIPTVTTTAQLSKGESLRTTVLGVPLPVFESVDAPAAIVTSTVANAGIELNARVTAKSNPFPNRFFFIPKILLKVLK